MHIRIGPSPKQAWNFLTRFVGGHDKLKMLFVIYIYVLFVFAMIYWGVGAIDG